MVSEMSAGTILDVNPIFSNSSLRRGDADARINWYAISGPHQQFRLNIQAAPPTVNVTTGLMRYAHGFMRAAFVLASLTRRCEMLRTCWYVAIFCLVAASAWAQPAVRQRAFYVPEVKDPVLEKIKDGNKKEQEVKDSEISAVRARQKAAAKKKEDQRKVLRTELPEGQAPTTLDQFISVFHFPPQAQFMTGTCWAFSGTSFLESEVKRISGKEVKMSEMYAVYCEYVEKARRFVAERGDSAFAEGSQLNAVPRMWKICGAVPLDAYPGVLEKNGLHDHTALFDEMNAFLKWVRQEEIWDEDLVVGMVKDILDRYMGKPPAEFKFEGKKYTPQKFLDKVLEIRPDDYVQFMSTMSVPFFTKGLFDVPDNWWKDAAYHNVPLDAFFDIIVKAIRGGYSVGIGGDVSEPGKDYTHSAAFVPTFDIPSEYIDQSAREYRITNGSTGDDHGIHLVGIAEVAGKLWFLVKDSGRSARWAPPEGYYFFREDFVKLKMLSFIVHKDAVRDLLERFEEAVPERQEDKGR